MGQRAKPEGPGPAIPLWTESLRISSPRPGKGEGGAPKPARALAVRAPNPYVGRVLSRLPSRLAARFWAALLVLTVAFHAVTPFEAPLVVRSGSAFSAATAEVAIAPARKTAVERYVVQMAPVLPTVSAVVLSTMPLVAAIPHAWPDQTGPPPPVPLARKIAPRGPPTP